MSCFPSFNQYRYEAAQKAKEISKAQPGTWKDFLCELVGPLSMILIAALLAIAAIFVKQFIG